MNVMMSLDPDGAKAIILKDGLDPKEVTSNVEQVRLAVGCYLNLCCDLGVPYGVVTYLRDDLRLNGLVKFQAELNYRAECLLGHIEDVGRMPAVFVVNGWFTRYVSSSERPMSHRIDLALDAIVASMMPIDSEAKATETVRKLLQFLCFFDRFTYESKVFDAAAAKKFLAANRHCRDLARGDLPGPGRYVLDLARSVAETVFPKKLKFRPELGRFSSGVCTDAAPVLQDKIKAYAMSHTSYCGCVSYPLPEGKNRLKINVPSLLSVPKGMVTRRVIAPESAAMNYKSQAYLSEFRQQNKRLIGSVDKPGYINERDSEINRGLAHIGSMLGTWATIDSSSFSDTISRHLFFQICPERLRPSFYDCCSEVVRYGGNLYQLYMLYTSGNSMTWLTESHYGVTLGRVGLILAGDPKAEQHCWSFGDDLIVPAQYADTVMEVFELFGHTVNCRKSYKSGLFRESCGGWYLAGCDVTPLYWPRHSFPTCKHYSTAECKRCTGLCRRHAFVKNVIDLQHKFFDFPRTREFLERCAKELFPSMTCSPVGEECDDLWDAECDPFISDRIPHYSLVGKASGKVGKTLDPTELLEHWAYYRFLQDGPRYVSDADRLAGISSPLITAADIEPPRVRYRLGHQSHMDLDQCTMSRPTSR